ncbi:exonuclease SbcCD subunit D [Candidatus Berkelbacteria bacterium]|nr:exonuclease SbcCD subunit D [Candidatus Berkelbacteria bacterium]
MRFLHFADIHFGMENYGRTEAATGLSSRLADWQRSYQFLIDTALKEQVDFVIFAGDAYKTRDPAPTYQRAFAQGIYQLSNAGIPVVMITGNHDIPNALGKATSLDIFAALKVPHVLLATEPMLLELDLSKHNPGKQGIVQLALLPWLTKSKFLTDEKLKELTSEELGGYFQAAVGQYIKDFSSQINPAYPAILVAHGSVEGAVFGSERTIMLGSDIVIPAQALAQSAFDYVALGHIHKHQVVLQKPLTVYAGSIERIDFGEAGDAKGFVIGEIGQPLGSSKEPTLRVNYKFVKGPAREFTVVQIKSLLAQTGEKFKVKSGEPTELILEEIRKHELKGAVVKVVIECDEETAPQILENPIRQQLEAQEVDFIASIQKEVAVAGRTETELGYSDSLVAASPLELLEKFFETKQTPKKEVARLLQLAEQLLAER